MIAYRAGQRVRIELDGEVLEVFDGFALKVRADVDGCSWYFKAPARGTTVTVLSDPRPDEPPGLGAVVEAGTSTGGDRRQWVRIPDTIDAFDARRTWIASGMNPREWADLIDPVVLSEGWTP